MLVGLRASQLGTLTVQFAPKKAGQASAVKSEPTAEEPAQAGPAQPRSVADDPFSRLIEQARDAQIDASKRTSTRKEQKLQVAFGGAKVEGAAMQQGGLVSVGRIARRLQS
jgi:hypothetical protein